MKIIAFIPRLFQGIINSITSAFKNTNEADIDKHAELAKNVIASANSQQLATAAKSVEQATEDNIGFDPNKKEFVFKKGFKHVRNAFFIVAGLPDLFTKFIKRLKGGETQYDMMAKELLAVVTRKKDLDSESLYCTIDTMHELYKDGYKASMAVRGLSSEVSMLLEKKMRADGATAKDLRLYQNLDYMTLMKAAITYANGIVIGSPTVNPELIQFAKENKRHVIEYNPVRADFYARINKLYETLCGSALNN